MEHYGNREECKKLIDKLRISPLLNHSVMRHLECPEERVKTYWCPSWKLMRLTLKAELSSPWISLVRVVNAEAKPPQWVLTEDTQAAEPTLTLLQPRTFIHTSLDERFSQVCIRGKTYQTGLSDFILRRHLAHCNEVRATVIEFVLDECIYFQLI